MSPVLHVPGQHDRSTDRGRGLRRVHLQGFGEQRPGRLPRHHGGVGAAATQATAKAQQLPQRPEASLTAPAASPTGSDWANGPGPGHEEGPCQELCAHVETILN